MKTHPSLTTGFRRKNYGVIAALAVVSLTAISLTANAATDIWSAGTNTTWDTTTTNWSGLTFTNGDNAEFSAATGNNALTLGSNITVGNIFSNGANTPATLTITGVSGDTLTLGNGDGVSGNIDGGTTSTAYAGNLTYTLTGAGSAFALAANSGPATWNIASGKTFTVGATIVGQTIDLGNNTINLTGSGTVDLTSGATVQNGTFNVSFGTLELAGGGNRNTTVANTVAVNVASGATLQIAPNSGVSSVFNESVSLAAGSTFGFFGGGTIHQSGAVTVNGNSTLAISNNGSGGAVIVGNLTGTGGLSTTVGGNASSTHSDAVILTGNNSGYSGNWTLSNPGTGDNATLVILTSGSGGTTGDFGTGTISGTMGGVAVNRSNAYTVNNNISGTLTFNQAGTGTTTLTSANTYTGATTVSAGTLLVNGNQSAATGAVTVASGATLGGTGTIGGATTVNGTIFAGNAIGVSAGNVLNTGALTLASTGTYQLTLNSTTNVSDELVSTGAISLNGTLAITDLDAGTPTGNLTIMQGTTLSGSFTGLAQGALVDNGLYTIDYTGNSVMLIAVPEPSTFVLAGIFGFGMLLLFRRRKEIANLA